MSERDDKELQRFLDRDSAVSRAYGELPRETPPADIDASILSAAREEAARPVRPRWMVPLALAATVVLGVGLSLQQLGPNVRTMSDMGTGRTQEPGILGDAAERPADRSSIAASAEERKRAPSTEAPPPDYDVSDLREAALQAQREEMRETFTTSAPDLGETANADRDDSAQSNSPLGPAQAADSGRVAARDAARNNDFVPPPAADVAPIVTAPETAASEFATPAAKAEPEQAVYASAKTESDKRRAPVASPAPQRSSRVAGTADEELQDAAAPSVRTNLNAVDLEPAAPVATIDGAESEAGSAPDASKQVAQIELRADRAPPAATAPGSEGSESLTVSGYRGNALDAREAITRRAIRSHRKDPDRWLQIIAATYRDGDEEFARTLFAEFREQYPNHKLPRDFPLDDPPAAESENPPPQ